MSKNPRAPQGEFIAKLRRQIKHPEVLLLGALFHDIAKGRGGDHSTLGEKEAKRFCKSLPLSSEHQELIPWLVREHLTLSQTAQKKDIQDPEVIREFAEQMGNQKRLDYLALLTCADILGTNPALWNSWRKSLIATLHQQTSDYLKQKEKSQPSKAQRIEAKKQLVLNQLNPDSAMKLKALWKPLGNEYFLRESTSSILWHGEALLAHQTPSPLVLIRDTPGGTEIFIHTLKRRGLFATCLNFLGEGLLSVVQANVLTTSDGYSCLSFMVLNDQGKPMESLKALEGLQEKLRRALKPNHLKPKIIQKRTPQTLKHFFKKTHLRFKKAPNQLLTLEIHTSDRPGLLAIIAKVFYDCEVELHHAKINTFGDKVEDVFFISLAGAAHGGAEQKKEELTAALKKALD